MTNEESAYFVGPDEEPDRYRLLRAVNSGGEADLWKAEVTLDGEPEPVAVKLLRPDHAVNIDQWKIRWCEQAKLLHLVDSPGVVRMHASFECAVPHRRGQATASRRTLCLVMNWVTGESLWDWVSLHASLADRPRALMHLGQVAKTLDQMHSGGAVDSGRHVIHGDLSPGNVIVNADDQAILVDFGLFRMARQQQDPESRGTQGYVAPEVFTRGMYGPAADRYAFGALTYFVLSGGQQPPADPVELGQALAALPGIDGKLQLQQHMMRMVAEDPEQRPPTGEWIKVLRQQASTTLRAAGSGLPQSAPAGSTIVRPPIRSSLAAYLMAHPRTSALLAFVAVVVVVVGTLFVGDLSDGNAASGSPNDSRKQKTTVVTVTTVPRPSSEDMATSATVDSSGKSPMSAESTGAGVPLSTLELVGSSTEWADVEGKDYPVVGPAVVNAKEYGSAVSFPDLWGRSINCEVWVDYNLAKEYERFESIVGLEDQSPSGSRFTFRVRIDDQVVDTKTVGVGETASVMVSNLSGKFRMRLEMNGDSGDGNQECAVPVFANPTLTPVG